MEEHGFACAISLCLIAHLTQTSQATTYDETLQPITNGNVYLIPV